jgi:hypothetical protein
MAIGVEELSRLIGDIYDASLDPALWPAVFKQTCEYTGGCAASLSSQDTIGTTSNIHFTSGYNLGFEQLYVEKYRKINPIFPAAFFSMWKDRTALPIAFPVRNSAEHGSLANGPCRKVTSMAGFATLRNRQATRPR